MNKNKSQSRTIITLTIFLGLITCTSLSFAGYSWITNIDIGKVVENIQSRRRPLFNRFPIEQFPDEYRDSTQRSEKWTIEPNIIMAVLLWHGYQENLQDYEFQNAQLQLRWYQLLSNMEQEHPIFLQQLSEQRLTDLHHIQGTNSLDLDIEFLAEVNRIEYDETDLWENSHWVRVSNEWENKRTQSTYLAVYLIYLDQQASVDPTIYHSLDVLTNNIGNSNFFANFEQHLDNYYPTQKQFWRTRGGNNNWGVFLMFPVVLIVLVIGLVTGYAEFFMALFWNSAYFRNGLTIFSQKYPTIRPVNFTACISHLEKKFHKRPFHPSIIFKQISENECAFKEKVFEFGLGFRFRYQVRGIMCFYPSKDVIILNGYLSWSTLMAGIIFVSIPLVTDLPTLLSILGIGLFTVTYMLQKKLYAEIGKTIQNYLG
jgi:hypothetical protein